MAGDDHQGGGPEVSPLMIGILGMLAGAIAVATYHCIAVGCYQMHSPNSPGAGAEGRENTSDGSRSGRGSTSASASASNSSAALIPVVRYSKERRSEGTCSVCLSDFNEGDPVRALPACSHVFHVACIDRWLLSHPNCPVCRANALPVAHVALTVPDMMSNNTLAVAAQGRSIGYLVAA